MKLGFTVCALTVAVASPQIIFASLLTLHAARNFMDNNLVTEIIAAIGFIVVIGLVAICVALVFANGRRQYIAVYLVKIASIWVMLNMVVFIVSLSAFPGLATVSTASLIVSVLVLAASMANRWANFAG